MWNKQQGLINNIYDFVYILVYIMLRWTILWALQLRYGGRATLESDVELNTSERIAEVNNSDAPSALHNKIY